ncbi:MAG: class I SAM-dependent methyltransferase [Solirubrobacteraceae bacterium]
MTSQPHRHPVFARVYARITPGMERELAPLRRELLAGLTGRVLEIGAGNGMNFGHYPGTVDEVVALEPEPYLRARAQAAAQRAAVPVVVLDGVAERLPPDLGGFDAAVACLVLCSVRDQNVALAELRRVLDPSGELRFLEHVLARNPRKAQLQRALDRSRLWPLVAGGCHCSRDTAGAIGSTGFAIERVRELELGPAWLHTNPHVLGVATPRHD